MKCKACGHASQKRLTDGRCHSCAVVWHGRVEGMMRALASGGGVWETAGDMIGWADHLLEEIDKACLPEAFKRYIDSTPHGE